MRLPAFNKTATLSLLLTSSVLGVKWHELKVRNQASDSPQTISESGGAIPPSVPMRTISDTDADKLLEKIWERLSTFTVDGRPQPEKVPSRIVLPFLDKLNTTDLIFLLGRVDLQNDKSRIDPLRRVLFEISSTLMPEAALTAAAKWPPEFADRLMAPLMEVWQSRNGDAAKWLLALEKKNHGDWSASRQAVNPAGGPAGASEAAEKSEPIPPTLAEAWAETTKRNDKLEPTNWTDNALAPVAAWAAANGQWEQALGQVKNLPSEDKQQSARQALLREWARKDWRGWIAWERAHPDRRATTWPAGFTIALQEAVFAKMNNIRQEEPVDSAELGAFMDEYLISMNGLEAAESVQTAGMLLLDKWVKADPENASAWLSRQKPGPIRDIAAATLAKATIGEEPVPAMTWAASISDPARREEALVDSWKAWRALEPAPADAWVDEHYPDIRASAERVGAKRAVTAP